MRQNGKNNRSRGRGRRPGGSGQINRNTTIDSNGPDVRLRGNASQLQEKYTTLGNDASAAGERISAEAYYQYADHYFRVNSAIVLTAEERREKQPDQQPRMPQESDDGVANEAAADASSSEEEAPKQQSPAEQDEPETTAASDTDEASA